MQKIGKWGICMNVLIVDDEKIMRFGIAKEVAKVLPGANIMLAENGKKAIEMSKNHIIPLVFLDVEMPVMNGLETAKNLKEINPNVNIIMTTAYSEYALDAYRLHIGGYLLKPVTSTDIRTELENIKNPLIFEDNTEVLNIHCFGEFKVAFKGTPLSFKRTKTKELLAYLVAKHGSTATRAELCDVLWEGEANTHSTQSYLGSLVSDLKSTLRKNGIESVLIHGRNEYSIQPELINCDYYEFLKGNYIAIWDYHGEFMTQYSWAEEYIWDLNEIQNSRK